MRLNRFELHELLKWLNKTDRKPLIIRGARQVGKSTLVKQLAETSGRFCLELNFERTPELVHFFIEKNPIQIMKNLAVYANRSLDPSITLLFLDEIQAAPKILDNLRYFYEEYPELPVIAAGSLLDFELEAPKFPMPVGRIEYFHLGPLSFEDFLMAMGEKNLVDWIRTLSIHDTVPLAIHQKCLQLVKQFWLIGGMPQIVASFIEDNDFQKTNDLRHDILHMYRDDFFKYGKPNRIPLLRKVLNVIPGLIGNTIKYSSIDPEYKSTIVREALEDIQRARIIHFVTHSAGEGIPLKSHEKSKVFKVIFLDIGMLCTALGLDQIEIIKDPGWVWINRGSLAEQFIGQSLLKLGSFRKNQDLFYWARQEPGSSAELDYILQYKNCIIPIEVKAGEIGTLKSLHLFIKEKPWSFAVRFNSDVPSLLEGDLKLKDGKTKPYKLLSLPFYLAEQLERLVSLSE